MFLQCVTIGRWPLILAAALFVSAPPARAQEDPLPSATPDTVLVEPPPSEFRPQYHPGNRSEEPLPIDTLDPLPLPPPPPASLSLLETLTQARQALHWNPTPRSPA